MELKGIIKRHIANWGKFPFVDARVYEDDNLKHIQSFVKDNKQLIARGNGRCYGDSSLGDNVFSTLKLNKFLSFDAATGILKCQAGVLFEDVLEVFVPKGFFLPVTPGTKFITVGGAVASDVHGKNHHSEGCYSKHVIELELMQSDGNIVACSKAINSELFWKTCGGMGLTGIIMSVTFQLKTIETSYIKQLSFQAKNLEHVMQLFQQHQSWTYSVAWIDFLKSGDSAGRSLIMFGEHAKLDELPASKKKQPLAVPKKLKLNVPFNFPKWILNNLSVTIFNFLYYNKLMASTKEEIIDYDTFFYPLDSINNWNRIYGADGFVQYQFVLPLETSKAGLEQILQLIRASGQGSFLTVLKLFGKADPNAYLSFPKEGYTLALDFKVNKKVWTLLDELDAIVLKLGGHIYLTKDARVQSDMYKAMLKQSYAKDVKYEQMGNFSSLQFERLK